MKRFRSLTFLGWPLVVVPQIFLWSGIFLNQLAVAANGGAMPVLWNSMNKWSPDDGHLIMTPATHLKILCDWITTSNLVQSPGDVLMIIAETSIGPLFWMWVGYILYRATRDEIRNLY